MWVLAGDYTVIMVVLDDCRSGMKHMSEGEQGSRLEGVDDLRKTRDDRKACPENSETVGL